MNKLTIEQIKNKYPILNKKNSLKCGFSVENGWLRLIDKLSGFIESQIKDLSNEDKDKIYVTQIKNKFGGLRYYLNFPEKYYPDIQYKIDGAIAFAESLSFHICQKCGNAGEHQGWHTLCNNCNIGDGR